MTKKDAINWYKDKYNLDDEKAEAYVKALLKKYKLDVIRNIPGIDGAGRIVEGGVIQDKDLLEAYISIISNESFNIKQQVKLLSHKNALDRVIFYLDLISKNNICIIDSVSSLAKEVNLPRETVSRILSKLEKEKYLIKEKNTIRIL
jgi:hypothetical protein